MPKRSRIKNLLVCLSIRALNGLLIVALVIQALVLYLHVAERSVSLPTGWLAEKIEQSIGEGAEVRIGMAAWRAPMTIELNDVTVGVDAHSEAILRIQALVVQWTGSALWWREIIPDVFLIEGLGAVVPAVYSGSGTGEAAIDDFVLAVMRQGPVWEIERADGYVLDVPVQLSGRIRPDTIRMLAAARRESAAQKADQPEKPFAERLKPFLSKLIEVREELKGIEKPHLELLVEAGTRSSLGVKGLFSGRGLAFKDEFNSGRVFGTGGLTLSTAAGSGNGLELSLRVAAQSEEARWKDKLELGSVAAAIHFDSIGRMQGGWPGVGLWVYDVRLEDQRVEAAWARLNMENWPLVDGKVVIQDHYGFAEATGKVDAEKGSGGLAFNARLDLERIYADSGLVPDKLKGKLSFTTPLSVRGHAGFSGDWALTDVGFNANCMNLQAYDVKVATLAGAGVYDPVAQTLKLRDLFLENEKYSIRGEYIGDLARDRYRFLLEGSVVPTDLNSLLNEDWWDELFSYFAFAPGHLPSADLDIGGSWNRSEDRWRMYFGSIGVKAFRFRGVEYDAVDLMLYVAEQTITLFNLDMSQGKTNAQAMIQWVEDNKGRDKWLAFSGTSTLPLDPLAKTIGKEVEEVVRDFDSSGSVAVNAAGKIWDERLRPHDPEDIFLRVNFADAVSWQGYDFDHMKGDARLLKGVVTLSNMEYGIADGKGQGGLILKKDDSGADWFHLNTRIAGADHQKLLESVPFTRGVDVMARDADDSTASSDPQQGEVDLDIDIAGPTEDIDRVAGTGTVRLRKGELGRIHILGGLSRALDWNVIHFGSFNLTDVDGAFKLADGKVSFPELEITGPTVSLEATGDFIIEGEGLDFQLYVHPLGGIRGPIMRTLSWAFDPVSRSFRVIVSGTWSDPKYKVGFNPLNVF